MPPPALSTMSSSTAAPNPSAAATTDDPKSASAVNSGKGDASAVGVGVYRDDSGTASVDHSPSLSSSDSEGEEGAQQQEHLVQEVRDLEEQEVYQRFVRGIDKEDMTARVSSSSGSLLSIRYYKVPGCQIAPCCWEMRATPEPQRQNFCTDFT